MPIQRTSLCSLILALTGTLPLLLTGCNTVQPPRQQFSDAEITTQVKTKLASDVSPSSVANIHVSTTNGIVTLSGAVETGEVKSRADSVTTSVTGVSRVNDELQVTPAPVAR
jgi:osmotically-inducible protein OsmY